MPPNKKHAAINAGSKPNDGIIENGIEKLDGFGIEHDGDAYNEMALSEEANDMSKLDEIDE